MAKQGRPSGSNSVFGSKLLRLRGEENISKFLEKLKVSPATYALYINGESTPAAGKLWEFVLNYAAANDRKMIDLNWLMDDRDRRPGPVFVGDCKESAPNPVKKPKAPPRVPRVIKGGPYRPAPVPLYSAAVADSHHASGESRIVATHIVEEGYSSVPDGCCAIRVCGDSMEPLVRDGQVVILAPDDRSAKNGDLVVVLLKDDEGTYYKKYFVTVTEKEGGGTSRMVSLVSLNPCLDIPPIVIDENDIDDLRIVIATRYDADSFYDVPDTADGGGC